MKTAALFFGFIAVIFFISSIQNREKHKIMLFQTIANLAYASQYLALGAVVAASMNLVSVIRCYIFYKYEKNNKVVPLYYLIIISVLTLSFGFISYDNVISLIPIIITFLYVIAAYQNNMKILRIFFIICSIIWFYYNYQVAAYASLIGNIFEFFSGVLALYRFNDNKIKKKVKNE